MKRIIIIRGTVKSNLIVEINVADSKGFSSLAFLKSGEEKVQV